MPFPRRGTEGLSAACEYSKELFSPCRDGMGREQVRSARIRGASDPKLKLGSGPKSKATNARTRGKFVGTSGRHNETAPRSALRTEYPESRNSGVALRIVALQTDFYLVGVARHPAEHPRTHTRTRVGDSERRSWR